MEVKMALYWDADKVPDHERKPELNPWLPTCLMWAGFAIGLGEITEGNLKVWVYRLSSKSRNVASTWTSRIEYHGIRHSLTPSEIRRRGIGQRLRSQQSPTDLVFKSVASLAAVSSSKITSSGRFSFTLLSERHKSSWYEAGPVTDVLIQNNTFDNCFYQKYCTSTRAVIDIHPAADKMIQGYFHHNIRIMHNHFLDNHNLMLCADNVDGLKFVNNTWEYDKTYSTQTSGISIRTDHCTNIELK